uniref:Dienelactone hydrolase domain-containing protein n=1 Tax=Panagrolaimus superbus TaxID=310955 RepID=A0A914Z1T8_9BILA
MKEERREYKDSNGNVFEGFLAYPNGADNSDKKLPVVLVHHAFAGITEHEEEKTRELARLGYVAFATDCFGKGIKGNTKEECFALLKPMVGDRRGILKDRLFAALDFVKNLSYVDSTKIGSIGFCFGGLCALDLSRYNCGISAAVSFHGSLDPLPSLENPPTEETEPIKSSIMICHGDADTHIPVEKAVAIMEELRNRQTDFQFISYANAKHAFTEIKFDNCGIPGIGYDEKACRRSWNQTLYHLNEILRGKK